ncbi:CRISPR-associated helicase/endonuclease Cas3 [Quadrisphaera sp. DSM 44207]|uniref:CRISPR-associated helicase/endonuclease Cas3 n=1 Tax=Quadrisphaera sp. DSM 44207 TaxID=1881057 RepID=UPI00088EE1D4|nr:CRISPR-associated helicase/endonuclease Cas3 [Quadrisphaera sp. DSM 44207]SDQ52639.1 CRISPR-associated helicase, Cas3 family [Quadrisphaera sp. DSM 44207]
MELSTAAQSVWAKSSPEDDAWLSLPQHLHDSAAVAGLLWDRWLPTAVRYEITQALPGGDADGRLLLTWLAGVHDIGKATPAFAVQVEKQAPYLTARMRAAGLDMPPVLADRALLRHDMAGQLVLTRWLQASGWSRRVASTYAVIVGGHHGSPPERGHLQAAAERSSLIGRDAWVSVQDELLDHMTRLTCVADRLPVWSQTPLPYPAQVLLSAAVIVADWLASNRDLFPYGEHRSSLERAAAAWTDLDLPAQWHPEAPPEDDDHLFSDRFDLPAGASLRPVQRAAVVAARNAEVPGLLVIEDRMGVGKTEAALAAAEVFAHRVGAGGVFVALPTMATSDAMFSRVRRWVQRLPVEGPDADLTLFLAHGKAALNSEAQELWRTGGPAAVAPDEDSSGGGGHQRATAIAHAWLRGRKKGPLSSFVVGTIDQVLFAALRSRHLALRHLALVSKVVVIDEVHAVDVFMGSYLHRVLHWLGAYGVPTVVLSATLPAAQRRALVAAYDRGRTVAGRGPRVAEAAYDVLDGDVGYPVITASTGGVPQVEVPRDGARTQRVRLQRLADDDESLLAVLTEALAGGGCAAVVRNTVGRAQATYDLLRERLDCEVLLLHSRFIAVDRATRERELLQRLGPPQTVAAAGRRRPERVVVVGTQVIEQSLDVDLDLMVTDLAPVDLVLQRLGRLHRHERGQDQSERPASVRQPRCLVTGVSDWTARPPVLVRGSETVYHRAPLLRSLAVLEDRFERGHLDLPGDIAPLVQAAYAQDLVPPDGWEQVYADAEARRVEREADQDRRAREFQLGPVKRTGESLVGWLQGSAGETDDTPQGQGQVRDSEDGIEVVVVHRVDGVVRLLPWTTDHAGQAIPTEFRPGDDVARAAATCTLRLPVHLSNGRHADAVIRALEKTWYPGWQDSHWLSGQLVLELDADLSAELPGHRLEYHRDRGLLVTTTGEER